MKKCLICFIMFIFFSCGKKTLMQVSDGNIGSDPVLVLPRHIMKVQLTRIEYRYERGINLLKVIKPARGTEQFKIALDILEERYGINKEIVEFFIKETEIKTKTTYKLDKTFTPSLVAVRDKNKIFKYDYARSIFRNRSLTIEYDSSGVAGKVISVNEDKTVDLVLSGVSAVGGLAGTLVKNVGGDKSSADTAYLNEKVLDKLEEALEKYNNIFGQSLIPADNAIFETIKKKLEEEVSKEFAKVFYEKTVTPIIAEMAFDIPNGMFNDNPNIKEYKLFELTDAGKIDYNPEYFGEMILKPVELFNENKSLSDNCYKITFAKAPDFTSPASVFKSSNTDESPIRVVYNIPQTEVIRLVSPKKQTLFQETFKIAQHGTLGYVSGKKYSRIEASYIASTGELKIITTEQKALTTDQLDKAGTTTKSIFELFKKPTETEELEKKIKLDELRKKWDAIEKEKQ